tara:strand:- start:407 stop:1324 length:918 start_codon:yes stop_codon:yes gene_type:complete
MNWITKFIKPKIKSLFKKKSEENKDTLWTNCSCGNLVLKSDLSSNYHCCPKCGLHHKISCEERFKLFFDNAEYEILNSPIPPDDPLSFTDTKSYKDRISAARKKTGQTDSMMVAKGKIQNIDVTVGAQNFSFIGGAVGIASGEIFIRAVSHAIENKTPLIFFSSSGGQKVQEGALALSMMAKTILGVNELKKLNIPYIICMTNPTAGGVTASWASLGDIIVAEPGSTISFAGARVIKDTVREDLPSGFQTAEYLLEHGQIDNVIERKYLNSAIGTLLNVLLKKVEADAKNETSNVTIDQTLQSAS